MGTLAKLYDVLILDRLRLWRDVDKCQAGSMPKRNCTEQIMTLRLCDYIKYTNAKVYVEFIDFRKAYDRVQRNKLMQHLKPLGCGKVMSTAKRNMYKIDVLGIYHRRQQWKLQWE